MLDSSNKVKKSETQAKVEKKDTAEQNEKPEEEKPKKKSSGYNAVIEREICDLLEGFRPPLLKDEVPFPHHFEILRTDKRDEGLVLEIENNTADLVNVSYVAGKLRRYLQYFCGKQKRYNLKSTQCLEAVNAWLRSYEHRKELPKAVGFLSDKELCLNRLAFDPIVVTFEELQEQAPIFADYLNRMTNSDAFAARVGSIFDFRARRKQAVWIQGETDGGKSQLATILCKLVGDSHYVMSGAALDEKYWKESIVGKRVMIVSETKPHFLRTEEFKGLTGDRVHNIRPFGAKPYQAILEPIVFFFSNHSLELPNDGSLTGRAFICKLKKIPEDKQIPEFELLDRIERELPYIAGYCYAKWQALPPGRPIPNDSSELKTATEDYEGDYLDFIENYLEMGENYFCEISLVSKLMTHAEFRSNTEKAICKRVILSRPGVTQSRICPPGETRRVNCYRGVRIRPEKKWLGGEP